MDMFAGILVGIIVGVLIIATDIARDDTLVRVRYSNEQMLVNYEDQNYLLVSCKDIVCE